MKELVFLQDCKGTYEHTVRKARKQYQCQLCKKNIEKGTNYLGLNFIPIYMLSQINEKFVICKYCCIECAIKRKVIEGEPK